MSRIREIIAQAAANSAADEDARKLLAERHRLEQAGFEFYTDDDGIMQVSIPSYCYPISPVDVELIDRICVIVYE